MYDWPGVPLDRSFKMVSYKLNRPDFLFILYEQFVRDAIFPDENYLVFLFFFLVCLLMEFYQYVLVVANVRKLTRLIRSERKSKEYIHLVLRVLLCRLIVVVVVEDDGKLTR